MSNTPTLIAVGGTLIGVLVTGGFGLLLDGRRRRSEERRYVHEQNERRREEKNRLYVEYLTVLQETHDYLLANYRVEQPPAPDLAELSPLARVERHLRLVAPTPVVEMARRMYSSPAIWSWVCRNSAVSRRATNCSTSLRAAAWTGSCAQT
jgi:hypothetical protein